MEGGEILDIGARLKATRESRGLTLKDVGQAIGVSDATVQRYERGEIDIKRTIALKLGECLSVSPSYIMGWTNSPIPVSSPTPQKTDLTDAEKYLLDNFRSLNQQGQKYILQTMDMASKIYKKCSNFSDLASNK